MHPQYFLYPWFKIKKKCFSFTENKHKLHCRGVESGEAFRPGKSFPSFQPSQKPTRTFDPHNPWGAHVCFTCRVSICHRTHTFQHIEQAHTSLPASPNAAHEGAQGGGRPAHHAPSSPAPPSEHRGQVASVGPHGKKCKTFCGAGQARTPRVFKYQRKQQLGGDFQSSATTGIRFLHTISEHPSSPHALQSVRATWQSSLTYAGVAPASFLPPFFSVSPSLPLSFSFPFLFPLFFLSSSPSSFLLYSLQLKRLNCIFSGLHCFIIYLWLKET